MELTIDIFGDKQFARRLLRVGENAGDMSPAFEDIHTDFLRIERAQFSSEGGYASGGWRPLAASTLDFKLRMGFDPRILHRTRLMRRSLTYKNQPGHIKEIGPDEMKVGTRVVSAKGYPYPRVHQLGSAKNSTPRRRVVELTHADRRKWVKILQRHLLDTGRLR